MKIKRIVAIAMIFALAIGVTACGGGSEKDEKALENLNKAFEANKQVKEVDATLKGDIDTKIQDKDTKINAEMNILAKALTEMMDLKKLQAKINFKAGQDGANISGDIYIKDGYMYYQVLGQKAKIKMDSSGAVQGFQPNTTKPFKLEMDYCKTCSQDGDIVTVDFDIPKIVEKLSQEFGQKAKDIKKEDMDKFTKAFKAVQLKFTIKDGRLGGIDLKVDADIDEGTTKMPLKLNFSLVYNKMENIGDIPFPADLKTYKEEKTPTALPKF